MAKPTRVLRVGDEIQRILGDLIQRDVHDPRLRFVSITSVDLSSDLSYAKVYFTVLGEEEPEEVEQALKKAKGFFRFKLGEILKARVTPDLRFLHDRKLVRANQLSDLIDQAISSDEEKARRFR